MVSPIGWCKPRISPEITKNTPYVVYCEYLGEYWLCYSHTTPVCIVIHLENAYCIFHYGEGTWMVSQFTGNSNFCSMAGAFPSLSASKLERISILWCHHIIIYSCLFRWVWMKSIPKWQKFTACTWKDGWCFLNPLAPGRWGNNCKSEIFEHILRLKFVITYWENCLSYNALHCTICSTHLEI